VQPSPESLPKAVPVRGTRLNAPSIWPSPTGSLPTPDTQTDPPRAQWFTACGVIGCFGVAAIGAIAVLAWIALTVLSHFGKIAERKPEQTTNPGSQFAIHEGPIVKTRLAGDVTIPLNATVDAVGQGAGGR